jgi:glycosyltransferase involved in cell wall biosynthesis
MPKFKIAIDISPLNDGNSTRGVGYYTRNLVAALEKEIKINPDFKNYQIDLISNSSLDINNYSLVHYPYFDPFKLTLPQNQIPYIVTCHDLIPRAFKIHFPVGLKGELKWLIQKHRLQKANYIICPSFSAKYQILDQINYPSDQIFVTYEAATPDFKKITDQKLLKKIKEKYQLPDDFVLFVGDINWNKNVPTLVKACLKLNYPLVIIGLAATKKVPDHPWTKDILWLQSQSSPLIKCLGFVPDKELPAIYNLAKIYCQPSYSEGFGLPLLQAMQSGTPVCYSEDSSLPEIMDFNGEYFDPYSQISLEKSLEKLWSNLKLRQKYSKNGQIRAKIFSWKFTALQTLALYRLVELNEKK